MKKPPMLLGFYAKPPFIVNWTLILLPFILLVVSYMVASYQRRAVNPEDKLLPSVTQMAKTVKIYAFEMDTEAKEWVFPKRENWENWKSIKDKVKIVFVRVMAAETGFIMLDDTIASIRRITIGIILSAIVGLTAGIGMGLYPGLRLLGLSFIIFISIIPPLAILPILFITFGTGEVAKVSLIIIGTLPMICRDIYLETRQIPEEQKTKALTLGASQFQVCYRIVLPQILPRLLDTIRLSLGNAWLFLIAAEAIVSENGLGYRIYLVRRRLAMDVIIPYVAWITLLSFTADYFLKKLMSWKYSWYLNSKE